ncbi:hypothetical protein CVT25_009719 [Psilocybe cyanescens]|uniref:CCHC-type domain-containing protein n=1 Tax=Psilocybe cyanescens TaxID=93625 RepID=A0A409XTC9_PSICY|nr:hypothetical protein CVT25_009719 [Psilocybe cyanescens]
MLVAPAIMNATVPQQPKQPSSFAPPPPQQTQYMQRARTSLADMTCYGCNQQGHGMNTCPGLADLASKKVITRDSSNHIVFADGSRIFCVMGESIIQAVQRQRPAPAPIATSNLAICDPYYMEEKYNANIFKEDDEDDIGSYLGNSDYILVGPSNRIVPERKIRTARKQVFDGVIVPEPAYIKAKCLEAKGKMKEKENMVPSISILKCPTAPEKPEIPNLSTPVLINPPVAPPVNQTVNQPITVKETPSVKQPIAPPVNNPIVPVLPKTSRPHVSFDPSDDDQIMEDTTIKPNKDKSPAKPRVPAQKWIAEVSHGVDPMAIAQCCLNRSADVTLGELMGVSKDVKNCIGSLIKAKTISVEEFRSKFASYDPNINIYTAFTNIEPELPPDARPEGTLLSFYDPGDETHVRKFLALPDSHPNSMAFITEETPSTSFLATYGIDVFNEHPDLEEGEIAEDLNLEDGKELDDLQYPEETPQSTQPSILTHPNPVHDLSHDSSPDVPMISDSENATDFHDSHDSLAVPSHDSHETLSPPDSGESHDALQNNETAQEGNDVNPWMRTPIEHDWPGLTEADRGWRLPWPEPTYVCTHDNTEYSAEDHYLEPSKQQEDKEDLDEPPPLQSPNGYINHQMTFYSPNAHITATGLDDGHRFEDWTLRDTTRQACINETYTFEQGMAFVHFIYG